MHATTRAQQGDKRPHLYCRTLFLRRHLIVPLDFSLFGSLHYAQVRRNNSVLVVDIDAARPSKTITHRRTHARTHARTRLRGTSAVLMTALHSAQGKLYI